jgi:hypothetical protein
MDRALKSVAIVAMGHSRAAYISEASTRPRPWVVTRSRKEQIPTAEMIEKIMAHHK